MTWWLYIAFSIISLGREYEAILAQAVHRSRVPIEVHWEVVAKAVAKARITVLKV